MPWGEHKGTPMRDVPASYLMHLLQEPWVREYRELYAYLVSRRSDLEASAALEERAKGSIETDAGPIETYEDYLRTFRGF